MGHWQPTKRPRVKRWRHVTDSLGGGASVADVLAATLDAIGESLLRAGTDATVQDVASLLLRLPAAAGHADFAAALRRLGLDVSGEPGVSELTSAFSDEVDRVVERTRARSDLGELAQMAAIETLAATVRHRAPGEQVTAPAVVRARLAACSSGNAFAGLAADFLGRFTTRWLSYQLSREVSGHVGPDKRFQELREERKFAAESGLRARIAAMVVRDVAGEWLRRVGNAELAKSSDVRDLLNRSVAAIAIELRRAAAS